MLTRLRAFVNIVRPRQIPKNLLVVVPLIVSGELPSTLGQATETRQLALVFLAWIFASSSIYILNDLVDMRRDRLDATRNNRPLASGNLSRKNAIFLLVIVSLLLTLTFQGISRIQILILCFYVITNVLYCIYFKKVPFWEMLTVSSGYALRVLCGSTFVERAPSSEFFLFIFFFALTIVASKRISEYHRNEVARRDVMKEYSNVSLLIVLSMSLCISVLSYATFSVQILREEGLGFIAAASLITSFLVILVILLRMVTVAVKGELHSPETLLVEDRFTRIHVILYIVAVGLFGNLR
jgi:decaprenyl-phosphate phosphoribosyltransferase